MEDGTSLDVVMDNRRVTLRQGVDGLEYVLACREEGGEFYSLLFFVLQG